MVESSIAVCLVGVIVCGSNVASLSGVGLLGLFEVGLYSQTLGFGFFCLWISSLVKAEKSVKETILSVVFLSATILSNVHILPLAACFAVFWIIYQIGRIWKRRKELSKKQISSKLFFSVGVLFSPLLISGIWLFPVLWWYQYAVGKTLSANNLFFSLGAFNLIWIICLFVAWTERKHNRALVMLCLMILTIAFASLAPIDFLTQSVPFQPARTLSGAIILAILPTVALLNRLLKEVFDSNEIISATILVLAVCFLAWLHPTQKFGIAALSEAESTEINQIVKAVNETESGKILVEIVESQAIFNSPLQNTREMAKSRALAHQIAMNGKPILWNVFREQALSASFATAVNNLFSNSKEVFGLDGLALRMSAANEIDAKLKFKLAQTLGVTHFLLKSEQQINALQKEADIQELWQINGWHYFKFKESTASPKNISIPVFAWLKIKPRNRSGNEFEFFNLAENLAFSGSPEIPVLYANSPNTNVFDNIEKLHQAILIVDENEVSSDYIERIKLLAEKNPNLKILFIGDKKNLISDNNKTDQIKILSETTELLSQISSQIIEWQTNTSLNGFMESPQTFTFEYSYFPNWRATNQTIFLDGYGRTAVYSENENITWKSGLVNFVSIGFLFFGIVILLLLILWNRSDS